MSKMKGSWPKLNCKVRLQKKTYILDDLGGRKLQWEYTDKNEYWADIQPVAARYNLSYYDRKMPNPKMYDVVMEDHDSIYDSDKMIWDQVRLSPFESVGAGGIASLIPDRDQNPQCRRELFYMCSPQRLAYAVPGRIQYVQIRVLTWQTPTPIKKQKKNAFSDDGPLEKNNE